MDKKMKKTEVIIERGEEDKEVRTERNGGKD